MMLYESVVGEKKTRTRTPPFIFKGTKVCRLSVYPAFGGSR